MVAAKRAKSNFFIFCFLKVCNVSVSELFAPIFGRMLKEMFALIKKDAVLEFRQRFAFFSILLYVVATVYISYLIFSRLSDARIWNALFWVILVFASINTAGKSFSNESENRFWYYYQLCSPQALILAKIIYNTLLIWAISLITLAIYSWFVGNPVQAIGQFVGVLLLGSSGFSSILTIVAAIAVRTNNNATLMAVLSIPLMLPVIIVVVRASISAMFGLSLEENTINLVYLGTLNTLVIVLGYLLFPYLWRE